MMQETEAGKVFPFGIRCAVVAVRVDGEPAAGEKFAPYFCLLYTSDAADEL